MKQDNNTHTPPAKNNHDYRAFLLRCWREGDRWHFSLESIGKDREQRGFASLETLVIFLQRQLLMEDENA